MLKQTKRGFDNSHFKSTWFVKIFSGNRVFTHWRSIGDVDQIYGKIVVIGAGPAGITLALELGRESTWFIICQEDFAA